MANAREGAIGALMICLGIAFLFVTDGEGLIDSGMKFRDVLAFLVAIAIPIAFVLFLVHGLEWSIFWSIVAVFGPVACIGAIIGLLSGQEED